MLGLSELPAYWLELESLLLLPLSLLLIPLLLIPLSLLLLSPEIPLSCFFCFLLRFFLVLVFFSVVVVVDVPSLAEGVLVAAGSSPAVPADCELSVCELSEEDMPEVPAEPPLLLSLLEPLLVSLPVPLALVPPPVWAKLVTARLAAQTMITA